LKEQEQTIIIDLSSRQQLNESFLRQFGAAIELVIKRMFGLNNLKFQFRGPRTSVGELAKTLGAEHKYIKAMKDAGFSDPSVLSSKHRLDRAVASFEKQTGIKWPLK